MIDGRDCQLTLRDTQEARLLQRLQAVLKQYQLPQPAPPQGPTQGQAEGWCAVHNVQMKRQTKGDRGWYSHWLENNTWCKGK